MTGKRDESPDPKGVTFLHLPTSGSEGTHLAHWPPPLHERESPSLRVKHAAGEPVGRAKPRGWRLIRAIFSEYGDGDD